MRKRKLSCSENEESAEELQRFFELRGKQPLEMTRKTVMDEADVVESEKVKEALRYFIMDYWQDLARPTLLSVCCESVGGNPAVTVPFAISLSVLSGGIDIHDDIIDESKKKHGRVTVYGKYGKNIALLTADALLFKGFTLLHEACVGIPKEKARKITAIVKHLFYELGDAEALELELRGRCDFTPEEYIYIIEKKAADVEAHAQIGAVLGNATAKEEKKLAKYGRLLGMIILIRDDIIDLYDQQEIKHRIIKEHLPLPLIYTIRNKRIPKVPPKKILEELHNEIENGVKVTNTLVRELTEKAFFEIKDLQLNKNLRKILNAFSKEVKGSLTPP